MLLKAAVFGLIYLLALLLSAKIASYRLRQCILLAASLAFYAMWGGWFLLVLLASVVGNFFLGAWIRRKPETSILTLGVLLNLVLFLGTFKYLPEVAASYPSSLQFFLHLALPLGLSFWTFQAMSYLFDQYRGEELDPSLLEFALYLSFFPCVTSGPICRLPDMLPQFRGDSQVSWANFRAGFCRIATGALMVQIGRLLGQGLFGGDGVNSGFDQISQWSTGDICFLAVGFGLQLFFDFAGYSHIAIGAAKCLGFTIPENFDRPFQSVTPSVFWTRWHMSLSFWIRDYAFLPMAMLWRSLWWRNAALFFSMVIFGLWHKGTILFALWGAYHGILLVLHRLVQQLEKKLNFDMSAPIWTPISWLTTMVLISFGWIFFRANSLDQAARMFSSLASFQSGGNLSASFYWMVTILIFGYGVVSLLAEKVTSFAAEPDAADKGSFFAAITRQRWYWVPALYMTLWMILVIVGAGPSSSTAEFMYRGF